MCPPSPHTSAAQIVTCTSDNLAIDYDPLLGSNNLLEQFTKLRETFYLQDHWFITKQHNSRRARWKRCLGNVWGKVTELPCPLQDCHSQISRCSPTKALRTLFLWVSVEASLHRYDSSNRCPLAIDSTSNTFPLPRDQTGTEIPTL